MGIPIRSTRADDKAVLRMLALRRTMAASQIGAMMGMTDAAVRVATDRVRRADEAEEGRDLKAEYGFLGNAAAQRVVRR